MKHWDLVPGETVTLERVDAKVIRRLKFLFRTTALIGCSTLDATAKYREWALREDGDLEDKKGVSRWRIQGKDRDTRQGQPLKSAYEWDRTGDIPFLAVPRREQKQPSASGASA